MPLTDCEERLLIDVDDVIVDVGGERRSWGLKHSFVSDVFDENWIGWEII